MKYVKIYAFIDPRDNQIRYIGKTKQTLKARYFVHTMPSRLEKFDNHKSNWISLLRSLNLMPEIKLLANVSESNWIQEEIYWIKLAKFLGCNLTNSTEGGQGGNGGKGCKGYKHTIEAKRRISEANKKPKSKKWIENAAKGKYKPIQQFDLQGNFIRLYDSATTAAIDLGNIDKKKNIVSVLKGKRKSAYGYFWKYL